MILWRGGRALKYAIHGLFRLTHTTTTAPVIDTPDCFVSLVSLIDTRGAASVGLLDGTGAADMGIIVVDTAVVSLIGPISTGVNTRLCC